MSQNSGPFLVSSHGHPSFNPRLPSSSLSPSLKRPGNGPMSIGNSPNTSIGQNMNVSPLPSSMRPSNSMGPIKPGIVGMNPMDKSNSMPYSSRYTRKVWPMTRSIHDKNIRGHDDHESPYLRSGLPNHGMPSDSISGSSFTIEPSADDDEGDDIYFSSRHMAAARFQRNQRLVSEIFNEICIPDLRSNVNVDRILQLRRQVDALKTHRDTFEKDLNDLEEKHVEKKRKFVEANEKFHNEYTEASSTNLSPEKTNEILQKYEMMEKLQKEKQLLLQQQQQQAAATPPPSQPPPSIPTTTATTTTTTTTTTTLSEATTPEATAPGATKIESTPTVEVPQEQTPTSPPPPVQAQLPPVPSVPAALPPSQPVPSQLPPSQSVSSPLPPSQPVPTQLPPSQPVQSQIPLSQPIQPQLPPPPPPVMQQIPPQQQQPQPTPQGYPMMHPGGGYASTPVYGHPQQTQYRPPMNQRPVQYPSNVPWQQQQQPQQQWQTNAYDPRYYNPYPPNAQWPQQQQWSPNQAQQQMGVVQHQQQAQMRGPPQQQQQPPPQMYGNGVHYGYGGTPAGWNTSAHPSQQYGYPQNPSYDPSLVPPQQQYYSPPPMHNPPQGYDYGPSSQQQQQQPPPPPPQMN